MTLPPMPPEPQDDPRRGAPPEGPRRRSGTDRGLSRAYRVLMVVFTVVVGLWLLTRLAAWGPGSMLDRIEGPAPTGGPTQHALAPPAGYDASRPH